MRPSAPMITLLSDLPDGACAIVRDEQVRLDLIEGRHAGKAMPDALVDGVIAGAGRVLATRTIANWRDRITTITIAPRMTCSARLPVYALLIGAFIPDRAMAPFNLRGLVLFALDVAGVAPAMGVAWPRARRRWARWARCRRCRLPATRWPATSRQAVAAAAAAPLRQRQHRAPSRSRSIAATPLAQAPVTVPRGESAGAAAP